jgi:hypothetical protein
MVAVDNSNFKQIEEENMSKSEAKRFFDDLLTEKNLPDEIFKGLQDLARKYNYDVTVDELDEELRLRWGTSVKIVAKNMYSEPPGF